MAKNEVLECFKKEMKCRKLGCPDYVSEDETCCDCEYYTPNLTDAIEEAISLLGKGE